MCWRQRAMEDDAVVQVFFVRGGRLIGRDHFYLQYCSRRDKGGDTGQLSSSSIMQVLRLFRERLMLQEELEEQALLEQWLSTKRGQKVYDQSPEERDKGKIGGTGRRKCTAMVLIQG